MKQIKPIYETKYHVRHRAALALAVDTYAKAKAQRPDHPSSHRLHAYALLKSGRVVGITIACLPTNYAKFRQHHVIPAHLAKGVVAD